MKKLYHILVLVTALAVVFSCTDFKDEEAPAGLSLSGNELLFPSNKQERSLTIKSGSRWEVSSLPGWIKLNSINPSSYYEWIAVFVADADESFDREGTIIITAGSENKTVSVRQEGIKGAYVAVESISLSTTELTITEGESADLTYVISPSSASIKDVSWSSDTPSVATVENGHVNALAEGTALITVTTDDGHKMATCTVTVMRKVIDVTSVTLNKTSLSMIEGDTQTLTATVAPSNATNKTVTWSSSNTNIATVDDGVVTALKEGTATITAQAGNKTASCRVTVSQRPTVTSITLSESSFSGYINKYYPVTVTVSPSNARYELEWSSSETRVAVINGSGTSVNIYTKDFGVSNITVTDKISGKSASLEVRTVVTDFEWKENTGNTYGGYPLITIDEGEEYQLHYSCNPSSATHLFEDLSNLVFYEPTYATSTPTVISIDAGGKVKGLKAGTVGIKPTGRIIKGSSGNDRVYIKVNQKTVAVSGVTLDKTSLTLTEGDTYSLTPTVSPSNATNKNVTWSSSNTSVATVSTTGVVTAKAAGTATITVKTSDGGKTATCSVTVKSKDITGSGNEGTGEEELF